MLLNKPIKQYIYLIINVLYYLLRYKPNTPLAFWRRDACHLKQQAGHITCPGKTERHPANMERHYILNRYFIS